MNEWTKTFKWYRKLTYRLLRTQIQSRRVWTHKTQLKQLVILCHKNCERLKDVLTDEISHVFQSFGFIKYNFFSFFKAKFTRNFSNAWQLVNLIYLCRKIQLFPLFLKSSVLHCNFPFAIVDNFLSFLLSFCFNYAINQKYVFLPQNFSIFNNILSNLFLTGFFLLFCVSYLLSHEPHLINMRSNLFFLPLWKKNHPLL